MFILTDNKRLVNLEHIAIISPCDDSYEILAYAKLRNNSTYVVLGDCLDSHEAAKTMEKIAEKISTGDNLIDFDAVVREVQYEAEAEGGVNHGE